MHALLGNPSHLFGALLGVPDHRDRHRDEAGRVGAAPLVDVPVVVGLHQRDREVVVFGGEQPPGEAGERREADRRQDAAGVHVLDPLVDVVTTRADLVEALRLEPVLLFRATGDRVERDVGDDGVAELPGVRAVLVVHQARGVVDVLLRQVVLEHVGRLDGVVVDADQNHVVFVHCPFLSVGGASRPTWSLARGLSRDCREHVVGPSDESLSPLTSPVYEN